MKRREMIAIVEHPDDPVNFDEDAFCTLYRITKVELRNYRRFPLVFNDMVRRYRKIHEAS